MSLTSASSIEEIRKFMQTFSEAHDQGDETTLTTLFDPNCVVDGHCQDTHWRVQISDYITMVKESADPDSGEKSVSEIQSIDITGRAAVVKLKDLSSPMKYTDYLTLIHFADGWKITHKAYYSDQPIPA